MSYVFRGPEKVLDPLCVQRPREGIRDSLELEVQVFVWEENSSPLEEQQVPLTGEPSLTCQLLVEFVDSGWFPPCD